MKKQQIHAIYLIGNTSIASSFSKRLATSQARYIEETLEKSTFTGEEKEQLLTYIIKELKHKA